MGMYTEIYINVDLKPETPEGVIDVLSCMCGGNKDESLIDLFPSRWSYMFNNGSYYTPLTSVASLTYDEIAGHYSLLGKGDIKNYEGEIEEFFEYIKPLVDNDYGDGVFMGYYRYEEDREPTLVYSGEG